MTTPLDALQTLAALHPSLHEAIAKEKAKWAPGAPPATIAFQALGSALVEHPDAYPKAVLDGVGKAIEELFEGASEAVRNALATGFLEAIVGYTGERKNILRVVAHLGPHARAYCKAWDEFTGVSTPGL